MYCICTGPPQGVCSTFVKNAWAQAKLLQQQLLQGQWAHPGVSVATLEKQIGPSETIGSRLLQVTGPYKAISGVTRGLRVDA